MPKTRTATDIICLGAIDLAAGQLAQQLVRSIRNAIARGELRAGERLPSTRALASSLGVARGTVTGAYEQLVSEGYLDARIGAGTRVSAAVPKGHMEVPVSLNTVFGGREPSLPPNVAHYEAIARSLGQLPAVPFSIAVPARAVAPDDNWRKLSNRVRATRAAAPSTYADPRGVLELRREITNYVRKARAVICEPEQVIITSGTQQGLFLASLILLSPGEAVWTEEPAYPGLTAVLSNQGLDVHHVPVDRQGIDVPLAVASCPHARAAFVTPSHQYPLGMHLSMARRGALLNWAREHDAWIVEDDYDSELRYTGHPFPSLQGLDPSRVIYLGTLSKVLFPSLRLGYAIVPEPLAEAFAGGKTVLDRHSPTADQHVLAAYMREGFLDAHIRRIRAVYVDRRLALIAAIEKDLAPWATVEPTGQGMHLVIWLSRGLDDVAVTAEAKSVGIAVRAISPMYASRPARSGLILGFGGFSVDQINEAVKRLQRILSSLSLTKTKRHR